MKNIQRIYHLDLSVTIVIVVTIATGIFRSRGSYFLKHPACAAVRLSIDFQLLLGSQLYTPATTFVTLQKPVSAVFILNDDRYGVGV